MPTDPLVSTSQLDDDGFPIAIGFQSAVANESTSTAPGCDDCRDDCQNESQTEQSDESEADDIETEEASSSLDDADHCPSEQPLTGYALVEDMMRRQDEVLMQLDDLNAQVESAIEELSEARKSEIEALESEAASESANLADQATDLRKAA